ncbi:Protein of unknown function [Pseudoxanthomonas sp. GM95]|nr:Protein of unknown function [Pseudoxanthomonas sp. GM95]
MPSPLQISVMHEAWVFGGVITQRAEATHSQGQALLTRNGGVTQDSFGIMDGNVTWAENILSYDEASGAWAYIGPSEATRLKGDYYLVGNVHRHFGHVMLEGLSRLWAMRQVSQVTSDLRFLVYESDVRPFALELLRLAGVPEDRIVSASPATSVERLFVPSTAMRTHRSISPEMGEVWGRISLKQASGGYRSARRKVYLSRKAIGNRPLENEEALEALLLSRGFEIRCSETMTIPEQIRMASESEILAGPVGSQMYLAGFQQPGSSVLVLAPRNFYLKDDLLLAAVRFHHLDVCFGSPLDFRKDKANRRWSVDLVEVEARLDELIVSREMPADLERDK